MYPSLDEINKVRSKKSKGFFCRNRKFKRFVRPKTCDLRKKKKVFTEIARDFPAKIGNLSDFSGRVQVKKFSVIFFGAQSSLGGGHNFRLGGTSSQLAGHGPGMPPRGAGSVMYHDYSRYWIV